MIDGYISKKNINFYAFTLISIISIIIIISNYNFNSLRDESARRISRQYGIEVAARFQMYMNPHYVLLHQLAYSYNISAWLNNQSNESYKRDAFDFIRSVHRISPTTYIAFATEETRVSYDFPFYDPYMVFEDFVPLYDLIPGDESKWFYDTRNSEKPFLMNIQNAIGDNTPFLWFNHSIYHREEFVGVVSIGFDFDIFSKNILDNFRSSDIRIYLIDQFGNVRADSNYDDVWFGKYEEVQIYEISNAPFIQEYLDIHLEQLEYYDGIFPNFLISNDSIELESTKYSFATIVPIAGTFWSFVVFSNHETHLNMMNINFVSFSFLALFICIVILTKRVSSSNIKLNNMKKNQFLANMSHEMRTPLSAIVSISEIQLKEQIKDGETREAFLKIKSSADSLVNIINDILDISKLENGKIELLQEQWKIENLIKSIYKIKDIYKDNIETDFNLKLSDNLPMCFFGDFFRINQIINNILSNAFKYTEKGSVSVSISSKQSITDPEIRNLIIKFEDTGYGMTNEQISKLFDDYVRFHENTPRNIEGVGLGMPIVKKLVTHMNGKINVMSKVGEGTKVIVSIPQRVIQKCIDTDKKIKEDEMKINHNLCFSNVRVLAADDIQINLYIISKFLNYYEITTDVVDSGIKVIERIKSGYKYDIIFLDNMMPNLTGIETLKILREIGYKNPVVVLTASATLKEKETFIKLGFDEYISKPIDTNVLHQILVKLIPDECKVIKQNLEDENKDIENEFLEIVQLDFFKTHQDFFEKLQIAISENNIKQAHLLAHTLKGLSGTIKERKLLEIAKNVEYFLSLGIIPVEEQMDLLEKELTHVLNKISEKIPTKITEINFLSNKEALKILEEVLPFVKTSNMKFLDYIDKIEQIEGSEEIIQSIENFEINKAITEIESFIKKLKS
ncbi:MAG: ATP-binding protein [Defluviitaleaceae bacterium]|nr:ATP-binding protein [Defluviitaleaceae bacterium]